MEILDSFKFISSTSLGVVIVSVVVLVVQVFERVCRFGTFCRLWKIVPIADYTSAIKVLTNVEAACGNVHDVGFFRFAV